MPDHPKERSELTLTPERGTLGLNQEVRSEAGSFEN